MSSQRYVSLRKTSSSPAWLTGVPLDRLTIYQGGGVWIASVAGVPSKCWMFRVFFPMVEVMIRNSSPVAFIMDGAFSSHIAVAVYDEILHGTKQTSKVIFFCCLKKSQFQWFLFTRNSKKNMSGYTNTHCLFLHWKNANWHLWEKEHQSQRCQEENTGRLHQFFFEKTTPQHGKLHTLFSDGHRNACKWIYSWFYPIANWGSVRSWHGPTLSIMKYTTQPMSKRICASKIHDLYQKRKAASSCRNLYIFRKKDLVWRKWQLCQYADAFWALTMIIMQANHY